MLELIVWMLAAIIVLMGIISFQLSMANRGPAGTSPFGFLVALACVCAAWLFIAAAAEQVTHIRDLISP